MTYSIKDLNKAAAAYDLELVKGAGYFYWCHPTETDIPSVYVAAFCHCNRDFWERELATAKGSVEGAAGFRASNEGSRLFLQQQSPATVAVIT
jgi:hypothetical protein